MNRGKVFALILCGAAALRIAYDSSSLAPNAVAEPLRIPFTSFPLDVLGADWRGEDLPMDEAVEERAGVTDYLNRRYTNGRQDVWMYVGYVSGYAPGSIHYPDICFPSGGLALESKTVSRMPIPGVSDEVPFNEYTWIRRRGGRTYTLSTFFYNEKFETEEWRLRAARIRGIRYFAIVTVSGDLVGGLENTRAVYRKIIERMIPQLLEHFPQNETPNPASSLSVGAPRGAS